MLYDGTAGPAQATARRTGRIRRRVLANHPRDRPAEHLTRGCDNLNTHAYSSFYRAFPPDEAR